MEIYEKKKNGFKSYKFKGSIEMSLDISNQSILLMMEIYGD